MTIATELSYTLDSHEHGPYRVHNNTKYRKGKYLSFLPYAGTTRIRLMGMISARSVRAPLIEIRAKILFCIETSKKKELLLLFLSYKSINSRYKTYTFHFFLFWRVFDFAVRWSYMQTKA